jgi:outer membrane receptor for ferrienterochelin and colicins
LLIGIVLYVCIEMSEKMVYKLIVLVLLSLGAEASYAQSVLEGKIYSKGKPVAYATTVLQGSAFGGHTDTNGVFRIEAVPDGSYTMKVSAIGYIPASKKINISGNKQVDIELLPQAGEMSEVVVTGTMKEVSRLNSPIPVEVYTQNFFRKNPTPSMFEAVGMINGVRPQLNCNVCNTGDIHINGMEGPYTLVLIDGMPIVSALSTVYGLNGIPNSIVERIEVVKGPAASLYGSEAMGGIVNVITKNPLTAPTVALDVFATSWKEYNADASLSFGLGKARALAGINYYNYQDPQDRNKDGFTDVTLQNRVSAFNKWAFRRQNNRIASVALRGVWEDRWGGQMNWNEQWRGSDSVYGENILTKRWEVIGIYQLPLREKVMAQVSWNVHDQRSWYGSMPFMANQKISFGQLYWDKQMGKEHNLLLGASYRYTV